LLLELTKNPFFTQELLQQTQNYLVTKEQFLNLRQKTISLLQEVVNFMEKKTILSNGKYVRIEDGINIFKSLLKITDIATPLLGANEIPGEIIATIFNDKKRKFNEESSKIFREHLTNSDNVDELIKQRQLLLEIINQNTSFSISQTIVELFNLNDESRIFTEEYLIYQVATNIWANKPIITLDDMKAAISELTKNLNSLTRELKQEKQEIIKLSGRESEKQISTIEYRVG